MDEYRLITLDPGHFHAALIQKEAYPGVSNRVAVYAPLSTDLTEHMNRVARFNVARSESPTAWELDVHASPDFLDRMVAERPGNIVVLSGRNRLKIHYIRAALEAGLHVLADKPWIIRQRGPAGARRGARARRAQEPDRLRHHDRALRDHVDAAARTGQLARRLRRDRRRAARPSPPSTWRACTTF